MGAGKVIRTIVPLIGKKRVHYAKIQEIIGTEAKPAKKLLKSGIAGISFERIKTEFVKTNAFPQLRLLKEDNEANLIINKINNLIKTETYEEAFHIFSADSEKIIDMISPGILGMDNIKKAAFLQLFADFRLHILLIGDPGVGKTEILRAIDVLAPKASFGLGSGVSKAGLTMTVSGNTTIPGLLPLASGGIACIDELNLIKQRDRAGLLNAMEKGFITYDKGKSHLKLEADVKVLATANPKHDRFVTKNIDMIKQQLPFEDALLSRFHMVFVVRRPDVAEFLEITKNMLNPAKKINFDDVYFVRAYIERSQRGEVNFDKKLQPMLLNFVEDIKNDERKFVQDVSPRLVKGIIEMAKAKARAHLKSNVDEKDLVYAFKIVKDCLYRNYDK